MGDEDLSGIKGEVLVIRDGDAMREGEGLGLKFEGDGFVGCLGDVEKFPVIELVDFEDKVLKMVYA